MPKYLYFFRAILWLSLAIFIVWLAWQVLVPSGQTTYVYDFKRRSDFIGRLEPLERVATPTGGSQKIISEPVYFTLRMPRPFTKAKLTIKYKSRQVPLAELGILVDKNLWRYDLQPLHHQLLNDWYYSLDWGTLQSGQTLVLQRRETYGSVADFLAKLPPQSQLAAYNYRLPNRFSLADYQSGTGTQVKAVLRGAYQFFVYLKDEPLALDFIIEDLNRNAQADQVEVIVYDAGGQEIKRFSLADDGVAADTGQAAAPRQLKVWLPALMEGVYKVEVKANDDIITRSLTSQQSKLSFFGKLWLADSGQTNINLVASGNQFSFSTANPASLQTIKLDNRFVLLAETYRQVERTQDCTATCQLQLGRGDVVIVTNGTVAVNQQNWFDPQIKKITAATVAGLDYVIANYRPPVKQGEWWVASAEFDLTKAARENDQYKFMFSLPDWPQLGQPDSWLELAEIKVELSGKNFKEWFKL